MKYSIAFLFLLFNITVANAADTLSYSLIRSNDWAFYGDQKPKIEVVGVNNNRREVNFDACCNIANYKGEQIYSLGQKGRVNSGDSVSMFFNFKALNSGFYNVEFSDKQGGRRVVNVAYEPEKIFLESGGKENFKKFLLTLQLKLSRTAVFADTKENNRLSGRERDIYDVKINTMDGGSVSGYFAVPNSGKNFTTVITFISEDEKLSNPLANFTVGFDIAELVLFVKKEWTDLYINEIVSSTIKSVDYVCSKSEVNTKKIFVQGKGIGGAYAFVACAASEKVKAGIIENPIFDNFINKFSVESFSPMVKVPILMGFGLQNNVENLQKMFSVFNLVTVKKEYYGFPLAKNILPDEWRIVKSNFMKKY